MDQEVLRLPGAIVRPAQPADAAEVVRLLYQGFGGQLAPELYLPLFSYTWFPNPPNRGYVLEVDGRILGYLGAVYSQRMIGGRTQNFCNISSWYVDPGYRPLAMSMLQLVMQQPGFVVTNLSPAPHVVPLMERLNFQILDRWKWLSLAPAFRKLYSEPFLTAHRRVPTHYGRRLLEEFAQRAARLAAFFERQAGAEVVCGAASVRPLLGPDERQILDDHAPFGCGFYLLVDEESRSFIVTKARIVAYARRYFGQLPFSDILHVSNRELTLRHLPAVRRAILRTEATLALGADERYFGGPLPDGIRVACPSYYRGGDIGSDTAGDIDGIYSEIALLRFNLWT